MLAIIIPYYKLAFFKETLISLANQTDIRFKVFIGDDASPESPLDLLEKYKEKFDFVYHRFESNLGEISLIKQWERCIALSKDEEWLMILGDDDILEESVVKEFYLSLYEIKANKSNVVRFASQVINEKGKAISTVFKQPELEKATEAFWRRFKGNTRSSLSEYVFSRVSFLKFGFKDYPLAWHSDDMAWINFSENNLIYSINSSCVNVRISNVNITGKKDNFLHKNTAEKLFFSDLVNEKFKFFSPFQRNELLMKYEIAVKKNRKVTAKEWKFLLGKYFKNAKVIPFLKCIRRFLRDFLLS